MIRELIYEVKIKSNSNIVKSWAKKFDVPEEFVLIAWKQAICYFLQNGKDVCKPSEKDFPVIVNIFKAIMKKWVSKLNDDIKYRLKNPTIDGKKADIHYEEAKDESLKEKMKEYKKNLEEVCCKKCPSICEW